MVHCLIRPLERTRIIIKTWLLAIEDTDTYVLLAKVIEPADTVIVCVLSLIVKPDNI